MYKKEICRPYTTLFRRREHCLELYINFATRYKKMNSLRQTACMVADPVIVDNCFPLWSVLRLNDGSLLNLFQMVGA